MKLRRHDVVPLYGRADPVTAVQAVGQAIAVARGNAGEGMHEIDGGQIPRQRLEQRALPGPARARTDQVAPADVRHALRLAVERNVRHGPDSAGHDAEAAMLAELLAEVEQDLHAHA